MKRLGVGLLGAGIHGERYARHLVEDLPSARLVAMSRRNGEAGARQAAAWGCRFQPDAHTLARDPEVDVLVAVVPPTVHESIVEVAIDAGKPLLLEKPATVDVATGRRMLERVRAAGLPVMVAQTLRYDGVAQRILAARAEIGEPYFIRLGQHFEPEPRPWADDPAVSGGGMLLSTGVHLFDLLLQASGRPAERVICETRIRATTRLEDAYAAVVSLEGGGLGAVSGSRATRSRSGAIEFVGERGQLVGDFVRRTAWIIQGRDARPLPAPPDVPTIRVVLEGFLEAIRASHPVPIPLAAGLRAVAVAVACAESAREGRPVAVSGGFDS